MRRFASILAVLATVAATLAFGSTVAPAPSAQAVSGGLWNPGYIISDAMFYDGSALVAADVQSFLQSRVAACDAGYTCLKDYRQATPTIAPTALCPGGYAGSANERASDILAKVGNACNISQKALLVLLEKEQGLVGSRHPSASAYAHATGFGCPDTAPCDPAFAGFFYQVYNAARQFQNYAQHPTSWNYQPGRVNQILYNPNRACGTGSVYIQNKATAGLYIYTPYQPNAAALSNMYGTGDRCSSYGNRNFWRIFSDWFGSPTNSSSLLRTAENATVYLVADDRKYPIPSLAILGSLAPLGTVGFVSQNYLNTLTTMHPVGHSIRSPGGTIYFFDAGIKLPFSSCTQALDYGASCDSTGYVQLSQQQADEFVNGPTLLPVLGTAEGARYYIKNGTKAEILDDASQAAAGIPPGMNVLTEKAVGHLPLVAPIVRDDAFVLTRSTARYSLLSLGQRIPVAAGSEASVGAAARRAGSLWAQSLALLPSPVSTTFTGIARVGSGPVMLLTSAGRYDVTAGGISASATPVAVSPAFADSYPLQGALAPGTFIKAPDNGTVYIVMADDIRPISSWNALLALTSNGDPQILPVPSSLISQLTVGPVALVAGTFVRSPGNATVYLVNGVTDRIAFSSFIYGSEAGFSRLVFSTEDRIAAYPLNPQLMTFGFSCGTDFYVAAGHEMHLVAPELRPLYPFAPAALDQFTCGMMTVGAPAGSFIRSTDGALYQLVGGQKRPIASIARFTELSAGQPWMDVVPQFAAAIPTGPAA
jgi:hypothetical protein